MPNHRIPDHEASRSPRRPRRIHSETPGKLPETAACPDCGAIYRKGRWVWEPAEAECYEKTCPACVRVAETYPEGRLQAQGRFALEHRDELLQMLRRIERREAKTHPLNRIMSIRMTEDGFIVLTTSDRLAVALGKGLYQAFEGELERPQGVDPGSLVRVRWFRN